MPTCKKSLKMTAVTGSSVHVTRNAACATC